MVLQDIQGKEIREIIKVTIEYEKLYCQPHRQSYLTLVFKISINNLIIIPLKTTNIVNISKLLELISIIDFSLKRISGI